MSRTRLTERDVASLLLKNLDLPFAPFELHPEQQVINLCVTPPEWELIGRIISGKEGFEATRVDELMDAWRELPPDVWTDENWIRRVCTRFALSAPDYSKLFLAECPTKVASK
jgi:hypothetical protein